MSKTTEERPAFMAVTREELADVKHFFQLQVQMCHDYMNQGKIWSRIDANGVMAEMYRVAAMGMQLLDKLNTRTQGA